MNIHKKRSEWVQWVKRSGWRVVFGEEFMQGFQWDGAGIGGVKGLAKYFGNTSAFLGIELFALCRLSHGFVDPGYFPSCSIYGSLVLGRTSMQHVYVLEYVSD